MIHGFKRECDTLAEPILKQGYLANANLANVRTVFDINIINVTVDVRVSKE